MALSRYREWAKVTHGFSASFIALHEASHAVTAVLLQTSLRFTEIVSRIRKDGLYAGYTDIDRTTAPDQRHLKHKLALIAAAPVVLSAHLSIPDSDAMVDDDLQNIEELAADLKATGALVVPAAGFTRQLLQWAGGILPGCMDAIHEVARQLDLKKKLHGEEVRKIVAQSPAPALPQIVQVTCGLISGFEADRVLKSYHDNLAYRSARRVELSPQAKPASEML